VAEVVGHLPNKCEALSSDLCTAKEEEGEEKEKESQVRTFSYICLYFLDANFFESMLYNVHIIFFQK
jgi:hypothetical protein